MHKNGKWRQAGTENGAGDYEVLARGLCGSWYGRRLATDKNSVPVGYNRVRLVPATADEAAIMAEHVPEDWKSPCGEPAARTYRFSTVVPVGPALTQALEVCQRALKAANASVTLNQAGLARAAADAATE